MKIAMVHPRLDRRGGAENLVAWLTTGLIARGHEVVIATRCYREELWSDGGFEGAELRLVEGRFEGLRGRRGKVMARARALASQVAGSDVVVAHNFPASSWVTAAAAGVEPRLVWYCHEPLQRLRWRSTMPNMVAAAEADLPWAGAVFKDFVAKLEGKRARQNRVDDGLDRAAVERFDRVLCNSAFTAAAVERVYGRVGEPCLLGLPAIEEAVIEEPAAGRGELLWIGSTLAYKNAVAFFEAMRVARYDLGALTLRARVVGVDDAEHRALVARLGLEGAIHFEPRLPYAELMARVSVARAVVTTSIDEPFGIVPLEAMARGRAVIASRVGGPCESVVDGVTGLAVDPLDPAAIAAALVELWDDAGRAEELGAAGRRRFEDRFTLERFLDRFERLALA